MGERQTGVAAKRVRLSAIVSVTAGVVVLGIGQSANWASFGPAESWHLSAAPMALRVMFDVLVVGAVVGACCAGASVGRTRSLLIAITIGLCLSAGFTIPGLSQSAAGEAMAGLASLGRGAWLSAAGLALLVISAALTALERSVRDRSRDHPVAYAVDHTTSHIRPAVPSAIDC